MSLSHEHVGPKISGKSKSMSSPEQNYFSLFAMRYPVIVHHCWGTWVKQLFELFPFLTPFFDFDFFQFLRLFWVRLLFVFFFCVIDLSVEELLIVFVFLNVFVWFFLFDEEKKLRLIFFINSCFVVLMLWYDFKACFFC